MALRHQAYLIYIVLLQIGANVLCENASRTEQTNGTRHKANVIENEKKKKTRRNGEAIFKTRIQLFPIILSALLQWNIFALTMLGYGYVHATYRIYIILGFGLLLLQSPATSLRSSPF